MTHEEGATPELFDALVDKRHRSYMSAVRGISLGTFRARVPMSTMPIHRRWVPRYGLHLSKKEVQHHMYRLICKYAFVIFINFNRFLFAKVRW